MNRGRRWQFGLRSLLLSVGLLVPLVYLGQLGWSTYRRHADRVELMGLFSGNGHGVEQPIYDGQVVLLRKGTVFGAFVPMDQGVYGESLRYRWYYRTDGEGRFDVQDGAVVSGTASATKTNGPVYVMFGPFTFEWSMAKPGWGWIYYDSGDAMQPQQFCLTSARTIRLLDASDARWVYKASASDVSPSATEHGL